MIGCRTSRRYRKHRRIKRAEDSKVTNTKKLEAIVGRSLCRQGAEWWSPKGCSLRSCTVYSTEESHRRMQGNEERGPNLIK